MPARPTTPCFTPGTLIATARGLRPVEALRPGDRVVTRDNGLAELLWVGGRTFCWAELSREATLRPVLIRRAALGQGLPLRDMCVSPRHRFLRCRDGAEVLVAAERLVDGCGVRPATALGVRYLHLLFARHEIILADGAWTESFRPGAPEWAGLGEAQRLEIEAIFPELRTEGLYRLTRPARPLDDRPLWRRRMAQPPGRG